MNAALEPYPPVNVLKPVADDVWIVDGPIIAGGPFGAIPVSVRMTVVRLPGGDLWLHSPVPLEPDLRGRVQSLGPVRHLVAPNLAHNAFIADWQQVCPDATVHAVRGTAERLARRGKQLRVDRVLDEAADPRWHDAFAVLLARGSYMDEAVFFHRPSRTLILTDLVELLEPNKVHAPALRLGARLAGVLRPPGAAPRYYRMTFLGRRRRDLREAVRRMIGWNPERVIFAHGAWFEADGAERLRAAFRWLGV